MSVYLIFVCACVVRARMRACARVCMCVCVFCTAPCPPQTAERIWNTLGVGEVVQLETFEKEGLEFVLGYYTLVDSAGVVLDGRIRVWNAMVGVWVSECVCVCVCVSSGASVSVSPPHCRLGTRCGAVPTSSASPPSSFTHTYATPPCPRPARRMTSQVGTPPGALGCCATGTCCVCARTSALVVLYLTLSVCVSLLSDHGDP